MSLKLLLVSILNPDEKENGEYEVAVDTVQAGVNDIVIMVTGSSARMTEKTQDAPVDATIVGIVDQVDYLKKK